MFLRKKLSFLGKKKYHCYMISFHIFNINSVSFIWLQSRNLKGIGNVVRIKYFMKFDTSSRQVCLFDI